MLLEEAAVETRHNARMLSRLQACFANDDVSRSECSPEMIPSRIALADAARFLNCWYSAYSPEANEMVDEHQKLF
jgi:hypothetical protein